MSLSDLQPLTVVPGAASTAPADAMAQAPNEWQPLQACAAAITGTFFIVPEHPLTGEALIHHAKRFPVDFASKSDLVAASGHIKNGGKLDFVSFYEALIAARNDADPNFGNDIEADNDYDNLSADQQALYDSLSENYGSKWTHDETIEFMGELSDLGVETKGHLESALYTVVDNGFRWEAEFAEEYVMELEYSLQDSCAVFAIDWQRVWDHSLTHDFSTVEFDGSVFIFHSNW